MQEEFRLKWSDVKRRKRIEIHINSLSVHEMKKNLHGKVSLERKRLDSQTFCSKRSIS
jgi:hypothetical protein